jgi:hypothetical protein
MPGPRRSLPHQRGEYRQGYLPRQWNDSEAPKQATASTRMLGASTISLAFFNRDPTTCMQPL